VCRSNLIITWGSNLPYSGPLADRPDPALKSRFGLDSAATLNIMYTAHVDLHSLCSIQKLMSDQVVLKKTLEENTGSTKREKGRIGSGQLDGIRSQSRRSESDN
jgi:hypothetical protein